MSASFKRRHAVRCDQIIHIVETPSLSLLLESLDPPVSDLNTELVTENFAPQRGSSFDTCTSSTFISIPISIPTPEWSPITPPPPASNSADVVVAESSMPSANNVAAGAKRKHEDLDDGIDRNGGELADPKHNKKAKTHHPSRKISGQLETKGPGAAAPAARSFKKIVPWSSGKQMVQKAVKQHDQTSKHAPSCPPPQHEPASMNNPPNRPGTPEPPPYSPITPPSKLHPTNETELPRDGLTTLERMLVNMYGDDDLRTVEDWDEELSLLEQMVPCRLPSLKDLGLDVLYEVGQMGFFSWREKLFGKEGEGGDGEEKVGGGRGDDAGVQEEVVLGPRGFWSVVM